MPFCDFMTNSAFFGQSTEVKSLNEQLNYVTRVMLDFKKQISCISHHILAHLFTKVVLMLMIEFSQLSRFSRLDE